MPPRPLPIPTLPQIGDGILSTLRHNRFLTADDIWEDMQRPEPSRRLENVPGIGPARALVLRNWASRNVSDEWHERRRQEQEARRRREEAADVARREAAAMRRRVEADADAARRRREADEATERARRIARADTIRRQREVAELAWVTWFVAWRRKRAGALFRVTIVGFFLIIPLLLVFAKSTWPSGVTGAAVSVVLSLVFLVLLPGLMLIDIFYRFRLIRALRGSQYALLLIALWPLAYAWSMIWIRKIRTRDAST
jgi:hypothetical protein